MKKKVALTAAAVALVGTLAVGGTLAWFTDTEEATNVVTMGEVDITLKEDGGQDGNGVTGQNGLSYENIMPGDNFKKTVTIKNLEAAAYVRATITVSGSPEVLNTFATENTNDDLVFQGLNKENATWDPVTEKDSEGNDVVVAYKITVPYSGENGIMPEGYNLTDEDRTPWNVFTAIEVPTTWNNRFVKESFNIKVEAEAIQAENNPGGFAGEGKTITDLKDAPGKAQYDSASTSEATHADN